MTDAESAAARRPRILVRCPNWVGDVVMATPAIRALRAAHPDADIRLAMKPYVAPLLEGWSAIDGIVRVQGGGGLLGALRRGRALREERPDTAVLLTNSLGTALEARVAGIPRRVGFAGDGRAPLLTDVLPRPPRPLAKKRPEPMVDSYLRLVGVLGARPDDRRYELPVSADEEAFVAAYLQRHGLAGRRLIGVNPGARFGASKLWRPERFAAAADAVCRRHDATAILLGGPGEEALLARIAAAMTGPVLDTGRDIVPLGPLKPLVRGLDLLFTTDTGTRAIAQAFGVPTVVVMGPIAPGWTAANNERARILRHDVPCGPCNLRICPIDHRCMEAVTVDEAVAAALDLLAAPVPSA